MLRDGKHAGATGTSVRKSVESPLSGTPLVTLGIKSNGGTVKVLGFIGYEYDKQGKTLFLI